VKKHWIIALVMVAALALPMVARAHGGHLHKALGTIASVQGAHVEVKTTDGRTITVMLDKKTTVTRGKDKVVEVPKGKYRCTLVQLKTAVPPGEPSDKDGFAGLFGIRGTIQIWMDAATGVPVLITGELPVPVIQTLDLYIKLRSSNGTPAGFAPVE